LVLLVFSRLKASARNADRPYGSWSKKGSGRKILSAEGKEMVGGNCNGTLKTVQALKDDESMAVLPVAMVLVG
jgi:hypothetical protein